MHGIASPRFDRVVALRSGDLLLHDERATRHGQVLSKEAFEAEVLGRVVGAWRGACAEED